jgi:hypothetical protein
MQPSCIAFKPFILVAFSDSNVFITFFQVNLTLEAASALHLAFILLAFSDSYVFITVFKVSLTSEAAFLRGLQALHPHDFQ